MSDELFPKNYVENLRKEAEKYRILNKLLVQYLQSLQDETTLDGVRKLVEKALTAIRTK